MLANPALLSTFFGVSSIAVLLFGLITGLHLGPDLLRDRVRIFSVVATANIIAPTVLGCLTGFWILARHPKELPVGISGAVALHHWCIYCRRVMPVHLRGPILDRIQVPTVVFLMPFFIALTGLRTYLDPSSSGFLEIFLFATVVSTVGIMAGPRLLPDLAAHPGVSP
jgi:hypothetical protein